MSARCDVLFQGYGLDPDGCGEPAERVCPECEKAICFEHSEKQPDGTYLCPGCDARPVR